MTMSRYHDSSPDEAMSTGPVFRPVHRSGSVLPRRLTDQVVALTVKRRVTEAGLNPTLFSGTRCAPAS